MAFIDLKPALSKEQLDQRILREFEAGKNKQFKNVIGTLYPTSMRSIIIELSEINPEKPVHDITKEERERILNLTKSIPVYSDWNGRVQGSDYYKRRRIGKRD